MIPKIIHLCWLSGDPYPTKIAKCLASWKKYLPDYEVMLWDTNRFDLESSIWVKQAFEKKKYAFAADYIRFYALYNYGGIYLDSDVEVLKSFDDLLDLPYFIGAEKAQTPEAAIIGAEKGCDWIKQCLDYYENRCFIKEDGSLDIKKLPEIMVEQISKFKLLRVLSLNDSLNIRKLDMQNEVLEFNDAFFSPKVFDSREVEITPYTYAIHHYQNSWFSPKAKAYYRSRAFFVKFLGQKFVRKAELFLMPWKFKK
jgi:alpha-N-acetylglucosamine transferase